MKKLIKLLFYKYIWINIILFLIFGVATYFYNWLAPFTAILLINIFDMYGYDFLVVNHWSSGEPPEERRSAYRIIQKIFEVLAIAFVYVLFNWPAALGLFFMCWFCVQDIIYHWFLDYKLSDKWTYPGTSPVVWIFKTPANWVVLSQAMLAIFITIFLILL